MSRYRTLFVCSCVIIMVFGSMTYIVAQGRNDRPVPTQSARGTPSVDVPHDSVRSQYRAVTRYVPVTEYVEFDAAERPMESTPTVAIPQRSRIQAQGGSRFSISTGAETILLNESTGETWLLRDSRWIEIPHNPVATRQPIQLPSMRGRDEPVRSYGTEPNNTAPRLDTPDEVFPHELDSPGIRIPQSVDPATINPDGTSTMEPVESPSAIHPIPTPQFDNVGR